MKAKLNRDYSCYPDGINRFFGKAGDVVDGQVAIYAIQDGAAVEHSERKPEVAKTPAPTARKKGR